MTVERVSVLLEDKYKISFNYTRWGRISLYLPESPIRNGSWNGSSVCSESGYHMVRVAHRLTWKCKVLGVRVGKVCLVHTRVWNQTGDVNQLDVSSYEKRLDVLWVSLPLFSGGMGSSKLSGRHHSPRPLANSNASEALPKPEERPCEGSVSDVGVSGLNGLAAVEKTRKVGALG